MAICQSKGGNGAANASAVTLCYPDDSAAAGLLWGGFESTNSTCLYAQGCTGTANEGPGGAAPTDSERRTTVPSALYKDVKATVIGSPVLTLRLLNRFPIFLPLFDFFVFAPSVSDYSKTCKLRPVSSIITGAQAVTDSSVVCIERYRFSITTSRFFDYQGIRHTSAEPGREELKIRQVVPLILFPSVLPSFPY